MLATPAVRTPSMEEPLVDTRGSLSKPVSREYVSSFKRVNCRSISPCNRET